MKGGRTKMERKDIQFDSHDCKCRGWFYKSARDGKAPVIILAHGFCGVKEMRLDAYAERFAAAMRNV
jgi:dienelactone hydrolase